MCLEMFVTTDGELLANEIAPRPHNSGHWTLDACFIDQLNNIYALSAVYHSAAANGSLMRRCKIFWVRSAKKSGYIFQTTMRGFIYTVKKNGARDERWDTLRSSIGFSVTRRPESPRH